MNMSIEHNNAVSRGYILVCQNIAEADARWLLCNNDLPDDLEDQIPLLENDVTKHLNAARNGLDTMRVNSMKIEHKGMRRTADQLCNRAERVIADSLSMTWGWKETSAFGGTRDISHD